MENDGKRKKVLLVTRPIGPPWDEASKNFAYSLALNIKDFDLTLLTFKPLENLPVNIKQEKIYSSSNFSFSQKIKLIRYLAKNGESYDICHFLFTPTKVNSWIIKKIIGHKNIHTIQTIATLREDLYSEYDLGKILFTDQIITYSHYAEEKLKNIGLGNVRQIYPGINPEQYSPAPKNMTLMNQLGIQPEEFIITFPGEFTRLGVIDDLVRMISDNQKTIRINKMKFIFACRVKNKKDFLKKEKIKDELQRLGVGDLVNLPDTFQSMETVFNTSDVVLFPVGEMKGKFDLPLAVIEAMACGKPVIISDLPILTEFANEGNSVKIKIGDMEMLWEAIIRLFDSEELRNNIGESARNFVVLNFEIGKVANEYEKIYKEITNDS